MTIFRLFVPNVHRFDRESMMGNHQFQLLVSTTLIVRPFGKLTLRMTSRQLLVDSPQFFSRSPEQFGGKIPFIVTDLIEKLRELNSLQSVGLFRISGASREIADLCTALDNGRIKEWGEFGKINNVASALKKYFRDLVSTDPLIPFDMYNDFTTIPTLPTEEEQAVKFRQLIDKFSAPRRLTFTYLFRFLREVHDNAESNKMDARNIAVVFSPNLIAPGGTQSDDEMYTLNAIQNKTIQTLILLSDQIFEGIEIPQTAFITDADLKILAAPPIDKDDVQRFLELRSLRRASLIPFVPHEFLNNPQFMRPTRVVTFE